MEFLILVIVLGAIPGGIAKNKDYNFALWWLYGAALFIVALPHSIYLKDLTSQPSTPALKPCPRCAESVKVVALVCRFCGYEFDTRATAVSSTRVGFAPRARSELGPIAGETRGREGRF